jgi:GNAT superfamily N-acetyltransferase
MKHNKYFEIKDVKFRKARQSDKATVFDFCHKTFGRWGDYIPEVWNQWVKDSKGMFFVADLHGTAVGLGKITEHRPGELWLEGLRVDPTFRGHGIGRAIQDFTWDKALSFKPKYIRYATGSYNKISIHLGKSKGMKIINTYDEMWCKASKADETRLVPARPSEAAEIMALLRRDPRHKLWKGFYLEGWKAMTLDEALLHKLIKEKRVYAYFDRRGLSGVTMLIQSKDKKYVTFGNTVAGDERTLRLVLREARRLGALLEGRVMEMIFPRSPWYRKVIKGTGWRHTLPIHMVLLEYQNKPHSRKMV